MIPITFCVPLSYALANSLPSNHLSISIRDGVSVRDFDWTIIHREEMRIFASPAWRTSRTAHGSAGKFLYDVLLTPSGSGNRSLSDDNLNCDSLNDRWKMDEISPFLNANDHVAEISDPPSCLNRKAQPTEKPHLALIRLDWHAT